MKEREEKGKERERWLCIPARLALAACLRRINTDSYAKGLISNENLLHSTLCLKVHVRRSSSTIDTEPEQQQDMLFQRRQRQTVES